MNTKTEMNHLTDAALNEIVGGSIFGDVFHTITHPNPVTKTILNLSPWGQAVNTATTAAHTVGSVIKHFKFW